MPDSSQPGKLLLVPFGARDPLNGVRTKIQVPYLRRYLADLGVQTVLVEPVYFDREFLSEYAAFYAVGARELTNRCRRLHFFAADVTPDLLDAFVAGDSRVHDALQAAYCGFTVLRPIPHAPLGRTVLRWYEPRTDGTERKTEPSREYHVHIAGVSLTVSGLAWQQQDMGVGSCSTVALWSALQSSALDPHYAVPTTTAVTLAGNNRGISGKRVFPSRGMHVEQIGEAIKELGLAPVVLESDSGTGAKRGFTRERFCVLLATLIRSGYPVVIGGQLEEADGPQGHAVTAVGFRTAATVARPRNSNVAHEDAGVDIVYIHDDNIGPNVRCRISVGKDDGIVRFTPEAPRRAAESNWPDPCVNYPSFRPTTLIAAVHHEMRLGADRLVASGLRVANGVAAVLNKHRATAYGLAPQVWKYQTRFMRQREYLSTVLGATLSNSQRVGATRRSIVEDHDPMSLHVGVVRIGREGAEIDIVFDTTGCDGEVYPFFHVAYMQQLAEVTAIVDQSGGQRLGPCVSA